MTKRKTKKRPPRPKPSPFAEAVLQQVQEKYLDKSKLQEFKDCLGLFNPAFRKQLVLAHAKLTNTNNRKVRLTKKVEDKEAFNNPDYRWLAKIRTTEADFLPQVPIRAAQRSVLRLFASHARVAYVKNHPSGRDLPKYNVIGHAHRRWKKWTGDITMPGQEWDTLLPSLAVHKLLAPLYPDGQPAWPSFGSVISTLDLSQQQIAAVDNLFESLTFTERLHTDVKTALLCLHELPQDDRLPKTVQVLEVWNTLQLRFRPNRVASTGRRRSAGDDALQFKFGFAAEGNSWYCPYSDYTAVMTAVTPKPVAVAVNSRTTSRANKKKKAGRKRKIHQESTADASLANSDTEVNPETNSSSVVATKQPRRKKVGRKQKAGPGATAEVASADRTGSAATTGLYHFRY